MLGEISQFEAFRTPHPPLVLLVSSLSSKEKEEIQPLDFKSYEYLYTFPLGGKIDFSQRKTVGWGALESHFITDLNIAPGWLRHTTPRNDKLFLPYNLEPGLLASFKFTLIKWEEKFK